jgi:hypothetical protein
VPRPRPSEVASRPGRPKVEIADIFRAHGETYRQGNRLSGDQSKVMRDIEACRTEILGGHLDVCLACGHEHPAYNSCRNRHCPKCQSLAQARWIAGRMERVLPTHYFHVVFTLPSSLRPLVRYNRELLFDLLFATSARTLLDLGEDPKRLGGQLGITSVLHTWTRELTFHPHVHCIVTGGGLAPAQDHWVPARKKHLFPVSVLRLLFRGKFLDGLRRAHERGQLVLEGPCAPLADPATFSALIDSLYRTKWVVYCKAPFGGPEQVFRYLGRYTHRVGISNQRLQAFDERGVRFATKGGKSITLAPADFIGRFLQHVLPAGFVKIRHFGLHASGNAKTRLVIARELLEKARATTPSSQAAPAAPNGSPRTWQDILRALTGIDADTCPRCGGQFERHPLPSRRAAPRAPVGRDTS